MTDTITIIDYNAGNIRSVQRACSEIGAKASVTCDPAEIDEAGRIIFPGVGAAPSAMASVKETGVDAALTRAFEKGVPILGICIGAQIILDRSEEGDQICLGLIQGTTRRFNLTDKSLKIPHMGWNEVKPVRPHPLLNGIEPGDEFYFVHSYFPQPNNNEYVYAVTDYGIDFCSALGYRNLFATQFHPEKSGNLGLKLLERFTSWDGQSPDESVPGKGD